MWRMVDTHSAAERKAKEGEEDTMKTLSKKAWLAAAKRAAKWPEGNGYLYFLTYKGIRGYSEIKEFIKTNLKEASKDG